MFSGPLDASCVAATQVRDTVWREDVDRANVLSARKLASDIAGRRRRIRTLLIQSGSPES
jgi:hypothetical protein